MMVGDETAETIYNFPVEMNEKEMISLFEYARNRISEEDFERLMVEWAMKDIIERSVKHTLKQKEFAEAAANLDLSGDYNEYYGEPND